MTTFNIHQNKHYTAFSGKGSKNAMKEDALLNDITNTAFVQFLNGHGYRNYTYFKNWEMALKYLPFYTNNQRYIYEMILSDRPCKPYLDIEQHLDTKPDDAFLANLVDELKGDICNIFRTDYNIEIQTTDIYVLDSCAMKDATKFKLSYHFIISTKDNQVLFKTNRKELEHSAYHLAKALYDKNPKYKEMVDLSVYTTDREMRTINSYKTPTDLRQLKPLNYQNNDLDYMITAYDLEKQHSFIKTPFVYLNDVAAKVKAGLKRKAGKKDVVKKVIDDVDDVADKNTVDNIDKVVDKRNILDDGIEYEELIKNIKVDNPDKIIHQKLFANKQDYKILEMVKENIHETCFFTESKLVNNKPIYSFNYTDRTEPCTISPTPQHHDNIGLFGYINELNQLEVRCRSAKCTHHVKILDYVDEDEDLFTSSALTVDVPYLTDNSPNLDIKIDELTDKNDYYKIKKLIHKWAKKKGSSSIKTLAFLAQMGLGKTYMLQKILKKYHFKRILWITHRQTLTNFIHGDFKPFGFESYLDCEDPNLANRIICQLDSLTRLLTNNKLPTYDLIIYDESESTLNHVNATTLKDKEFIFDLMTEITDSSSKIIALDADYSDRSHLYFSYFGKVQVIINKHVKYKKHFKWLDDMARFKAMIWEDIEAGKNVVIVCMNSAFVENFYAELKEKGIGVVKHTRHTADSCKEELKDVDKYWTKFQVVIYSPTVEAGVSFDKKHFQKMYSVICQMSCSARSFIQMTGRIRTLESDEVITFIDKAQISIQKYGPLYSYDDAKNYFAYIYDNANFPKSIIKSTDGQKIVINCISKLYSQIQMYNKVEEMNNTRSNFIPSLIKLFTRKGYTFEPFDEIPVEKPKKNKKKEVGAIKTKILEAKDVSSNEIDGLIKSKNNNTASEDEKYQIEKYMMKKTWGVKKLTPEFLECFYGKEYRLNNLSALIDNTNITEKDGIKLEELKLKCKIIKELLCMLQFISVANRQVKLTSEQLHTSIKNILKDSILFKNYDKHRMLFGLEKTKSTKEWSSKMFLNTINALLERFGLIIKNKQKSTHVKGLAINNNIYYIEYLDNINELLKDNKNKLFIKKSKIWADILE
jgi:hypothetical protein